MREVAGCLIYNHKKEILLVRRSGGTGWTIPKGGTVKGLSRKASAVKEVYEEAGVVGAIQSKLTTLYGVEEILHIYPMELVELLKKYPEKTYRERKFFSYKQAKQNLPKQQQQLLKMWLAFYKSED